VNLVLGTLELTTIGGVGTYLVTVAEQLERMGHEVTIFSRDTGEMATIATGRGLRVVTSEEELPDACDAVYAQDAPSAYALAGRYPEVPQAFCLHSTEHDRWLVPQLAGMTGATVVLHERAARHARSLGHVPEVIRLRQPVDTRRFAPRGSIGVSPGRALVLGNYLSGNRLELIREACSEAGIELVERGLQAGEFASAPESQMNDCDIVVGKSRVIVEAMSSGRAAYVYDHGGCDGWVTADRYSLLEADNFEGQADLRPVDAERLRADLLAYRTEMGPANRDLALAHHSARSHCEALVELLASLAPRRDRAGAEPDEIARLTRVQWETDARALGFEHEAKLLRAELSRRNREQRELHRETERAQRLAADAEQRAVAAEREAASPLAPLRRLRRASR
jgi:hypothetical protein